jgi:hypothetical protein
MFSGKHLLWMPFIAGFCMIQSCKSPAANDVVNIANATIADSTESSCPYLTKDTKGNIVLSWIRSNNDSSAVVCYAVSADGGKTFGQPVLVPASTNVYPHGENMPKMLFMPNDEVIAVWGASNPNPKNPYSGLVFYSQSFDNGKTWSGLNRLVKDTASIDERYFDVALLPNGNAAIIWLDSRTTTKKEGSTLYFATTNGKDGFSDGHPIGTTCCQCCRTDLFIDSKQNIHVAYRDIINDSVRDMVHAVSTDGGAHFSNPERISKDNWVVNGCPHTGPTMAENKQGLNFAWYTGGHYGGIFYCQSTDGGKTFSPRDSVSLHAMAKHPQIISLSNGKLLIVWDESIKKSDKTNSCSCLQLRDADGKTLVTKHITSDSTVANFPVIKSVTDSNVIVAYTMMQQGGKNHVYYRMLSVIPIK